MASFRLTIAATLYALRRSYFLLATCLLAYLLLVRICRYQRAEQISSVFGHGKRPLSSMTTEEAHNIMTQLQELEFPNAFHKARKIALLKAGGIPTMSKLFAVTGQNNRRNAGKRAIDTEILLREVQSKDRGSIRYMQAVARMNYFHFRYRKAGKILDEDLLHTLGDGLLESLRVVDDQEWRKLTDVEKCAIGIFHKNLGEDMEIPYAPLPSSQMGWVNGLHFATELRDWTIQYEAAVAKPVATNDQYVRVYVDSATSALPKAITHVLRKALGSELDDTMRTSLCLEAPGPILKPALEAFTNIRKLGLRHLSLPRPSFLAVKAVEDDANPLSGLYNFNYLGLRPWYVKPTFWRSWGPVALLLGILGGRAPGTGGDKYYPQGYDLKTIGPKPQEGKGLDEMRTTIEFLKARGSVNCPFSNREKI
ncbi:dephospho- kinase protein [Rutstroemia sp. NJR-2017a BBW]|nr:dephospho- kinase protein [Rutstroemia sp. NJR-2017a BBW]